MMIFTLIKEKSKITIFAILEQIHEYQDMHHK